MLLHTPSPKLPRRIRRSKHPRTIHGFERKWMNLSQYMLHNSASFTPALHFFMPNILTIRCESHNRSIRLINLLRITPTMMCTIQAQQCSSFLNNNIENTIYPNDNKVSQELLTTRKEKSDEDYNQQNDIHFGN